jgi:hypothetical protein
MSRCYGAAKRKHRHERGHLNVMEEGWACPVPRNTLLRFVADVAGVGGHSRAVLDMLQDSRRLVVAKTRVDEAVKLVASFQGRKIPSSPSTSDEPKNPTSTVAAGVNTASIGEPALDIQYASIGPDILLCEHSKKRCNKLLHLQGSK